MGSLSLSGAPGVHRSSVFIHLPNYYSLVLPNAGAVPTIPGASLGRRLGRRQPRAGTAPAPGAPSCCARACAHDGTLARPGSGLQADFDELGVAASTR